MSRRINVLVTGAGGFIGHHLVRFLKAEGHCVRGVDTKRPQFEPSLADEFEILDLREPGACVIATRAIDYVYHLAADMGGIGYITRNHSTIAANNTLIDVNMLQAAEHNGVRRLFYSSSACVYPQHLQNDADVIALRESDACPADPEEGYGWEKLYGERLCTYFRLDARVDTRIARFHNVYGPLGTFDGGREKAPAAICRKIALTHDGGEIEVWGDGCQTRSFMYVDDCVEGISRLLHSEHAEPLNLGSDELVTINELVDAVAAIAGKKVFKRHDLSGPQGVRGRNCDTSLLRSALGWEPRTPLADGLTSTYRWVCDELARAQTSFSADIHG